MNLIDSLAYWFMPPKYRAAIDHIPILINRSDADGHITNSIEESLQSNDYDGSEWYTFLIAGTPNPTTFPSESAQSIYIPINVKRLVNSNEDTYAIDENNVPHLLNTEAIYRQIINGDSVATAGNPVYQLVTGSRNPYYIGEFLGVTMQQDDILSTYDSYNQQFLYYDKGQLHIRKWEAFVEKAYIPLMKKIMTSRTPFVILNGRLVVYARGFRWVFNNTSHTVVQPIIPSKYEHEFTSDPIVIRHYNCVYLQSYAICQRATNAIYYILQSRPYAESEEFMIKIPKKYDIIEFNLSHRHFRVIVTDTITGMSYYCTYNQGKWNWDGIGKVNLYSTIPNLHVVDCFSTVICVRDNQMTILDKNQFLGLNGRPW